MHARERKRQQIIVAAKRVFSEKGFNKSTMENIAHEAELSPGTPVLCLKNKDELYASLSLRILHYLLIRLEHLDSDAHSNIELRISGLKEAMFDVYEFDPMILINMFHLQSSDTLKKLTPELLSEIKNLSKRSLSEMAKLFQEGVQQGVFIDKHLIKSKSPNKSKTLSRHG